jgi:hypothetical protein
MIAASSISFGNCLKFDSQIRTTNGIPTKIPARTTALVVNGIDQPVISKIDLPSSPFLPMSDMSAIPATVGGKTIGARTKGRIKLLILFELFAKIQANGTPNVSEIKAAKVEVQIDNLMAVKSESDPKKLLQGTFAIKETNGVIMIAAAATDKILVIMPNFTLNQTL